MCDMRSLCSLEEIDRKIHLEIRQCGYLILKKNLLHCFLTYSSLVANRTHICSLLIVNFLQQLDTNGLHLKCSSVQYRNA